MKRLMHTLSVVWLATGLVLGAAGAAAADDSLSTARDLYAAASYEDALAMLNRLRAPAAEAGQERVIEQYRALCLLALNRPSEAQHAIEIVVAADPMFQPSDTDASPRVRSAFSDVRRRMLPAIIQQRYAAAKDAFDRKDFPPAKDGFNQVIQMLGDPDVGAAGSQPPLSDLRTLAAGFRDLAVTAAAPPPPAPAPASVAAAPSPANPPPRVVLPPRIYAAEDDTVVAPVVIRQTVPPYPTRVINPLKGTLAIVIDERGTVESAMMVVPFGNAYDHTILEAASQWRYRPATLKGVPVRFRRIMQINLAPSK
jgi:hypothetical protein